VCVAEAVNGRECYRNGQVSWVLQKRLRVVSVAEAAIGYVCYRSVIWRVCGRIVHQACVW